MRILTWNINSVRLRLPLLARLSRHLKPDVICLQEIKAADEFFPAEALSQLGYPHQVVRGMKAYNGVAVLARAPIQEIRRRNWAGKDDARHVGVALAGGTELHNFYVPAGGDIPDPATNPKFAHKLAFLEEMKAWSKAGPAVPRIVVGDLNVAPLPEDVWSHRQMLGVVSHTPVETGALDAIRKNGGYVDALRVLQPAPEKLFSWWSYRSPDWEKSDRGRRLDHVWLAGPLSGKLQDGGIHKAARGWARASDHAPVWVDLSL